TAEPASDLCQRCGDADRGGALRRGERRPGDVRAARAVRGELGTGALGSSFPAHRARDKAYYNARAISNSPPPATTIPMVRAARAPFGASRSTVMAIVTTAMARRSMRPSTISIAVRLALQQQQSRPKRSPWRQAVA